MHLRALSSAPKEKPSVQISGSTSREESRAGAFIVPAFIIGTLALGFYLDKHDYMHTRESKGVVAATPGPLKGLTETVRDNVPGAYKKFS